jgi:hypothetical protein
MFNPRPLSAVIAAAAATGAVADPPSVTVMPTR